MAEQAGERVKVTLRWVQILDKLEPFFKERGEFVFKAKVSTRDGGGQSQETRLPEEGGHYEISDHPAWNKVVLNKVLFEGEVSEHLEVEMLGEEIDTLTANDQLDSYHRVFEGPVSEWLGWYGPGDERSTDPENMSNWRICYVIEKA